MRTEYDEADIRQAMQHLMTQVIAGFAKAEPLGIVGIRTRGEIVADRLAGLLRDEGFKRLGRGVLDVTFYRDDLSHKGAKPLVRPTEIQFELNDHPVLLVDDVIFTGRSIRAALDALTDFGRPSAIRLGVLADRGGRELPIQPDFVGLMLKDVPPDHRVNVRMKEMDGRDQIVVEPRN
jgi:pyrimidine operon attenuation protein/uracil phosphoribosyltransferase